MSRPQNCFEPYPSPKNSPLGPKKVKNDPKNQSKSNIKIEGTIKNKSCSTKREDLKTVFESYPDPQKANEDQKKSKK